ncbi:MULTISPECIES: hypothetical protein [Moorena]|uniref:Uncharacterized protein n=1 Tax=Moorena producens 3L TaxID=489825 RepID=F4Y261_9CYAN|nr:MULTISPECIES: hypothetical protein [Moorena]EGJ29353.1 hypothetical protein LYNGBM3L_67460 [Moorena producens 3L]
MILTAHPTSTAPCSLLPAPYSLKPKTLYLNELKTAVMKQTHYLTTTVQQGNRLEISLPNLPVGQTIEVILIVPETAQNHSMERQAFQQLPLEERRRILAQQAEAMKDYYQENQEWKDWINFDNE